MAAWVARITNIHRREIGVAMLAALLFYLILTSFMLLRPVRESLGLDSGLEIVRWLFMGTLIVTLAVHPVFAWIVSKFSRRVFVPMAYRFLAANLLLFWAIITFWPEEFGVLAGQVFYVWLSVFNLVATSLFWAVLADGMNLRQGKRLFAFIAIGGTLGAISGSASSSMFAQAIGTTTLLLVAVVLLEACAWVVIALSHKLDSFTDETIAGKPLAISRMVIGGHAWAGMRQVITSPYLINICMYVVLMAIVMTFLYFTQLRLVDDMGLDRDGRTQMFAVIDLWTQIGTLTLQAIIAGHLIRRAGVGVSLAILPVITAGGIIALALVPTIGLLIVVQAAVRAVQRAIARPARETLFTVVSREDKYKAKSFIDTFIYRGGDVIGAQVERPLSVLAPGLVGIAVAIVPIAVAWTGISIYLGIRQSTLAKSDFGETESTPAGSTINPQGADV